MSNEPEKTPPHPHPIVKIHASGDPIRRHPNGTIYRDSPEYRRLLALQRAGH